MKPQVADILAAAGRVLLSAIFVHEAWFKVTHYATSARFAESGGLPASLLPLAIVVEAAAGLLVLVGLFTRCAALALAGFCIFTALVFHTRFGDFNQLMHFEKNLAIAGGFLVLAAFGAGRLSLDAWWRG
ncbi:MAG: DoxX family protein [Pseudorhodoplanes sp.]